MKDLFYKCVGLLVMVFFVQIFRTSEEHPANLLFLIIPAVFYFLPTIIAFRRKKDNKQSVFVLNLLLGWTLVGWAVALSRAVEKDLAKIVNNIKDKDTDIQQLVALGELKEKGLITDDEFLIQKQKIINKTTA